MLDWKSTMLFQIDRMNIFCLFQMQKLSGFSETWWMAFLNFRSEETVASAKREKESPVFGQLWTSGSSLSSLWSSYLIRNFQPNTQRPHNLFWGKMLIRWLKLPSGAFLDSSFSRRPFWTWVHHCSCPPNAHFAFRPFGQLEWTPEVGVISLRITSFIRELSLLLESYIQRMEST